MANPPLPEYPRHLWPPRCSVLQLKIIAGATATYDSLRKICVQLKRCSGGRKLWVQEAALGAGPRKSEPNPTFHLALAKFFSIWAQTPSLMFLSDAALPEILERRQVPLIGCSVPSRRLHSPSLCDLGPPGRASGLVRDLESPPSPSRPQG